MKFKELDNGLWFQIPNSDFKYIKINPPIEDKWGNLLVAITNSGFAVDSEDITPETEVFPIEN